MLHFFFYFSSFSQINQLFSIGLNLPSIIKAFYEIFLETMSVMPLFTFVLYILWSFIFILFNITLFFLWKQKKQNQALISNFDNINNTEKVNNHTNKIATISSFFSFLGFGCIACGQTLLLSILTIFFSVSASFVYLVGNIILIIGILLLLYAIHKNLKQIFLDKMCEI